MFWLCLLLALVSVPFLVLGLAIYGLMAYIIAAFVAWRLAHD